jgi:hypothetical protein
LTTADVLSGKVGGTNAETAVHIAAVPKTTAGRIVERGTVLQGLALRAPAPATARLGESPVGLLTWPDLFWRVVFLERCCPSAI